MIRTLMMARQSFPDIISDNFGLQVFGQIAVGGILVDGAGQSRFKSDQMESTLNRINIVCKRKKLFVIGVVVLNGDFDLNIILHRLL